MELPAKYRFGEFEFDTLRRLLVRNGEPIAVSPKSLDVLTLLVQRAPELVSKEEILAEIWPGVAVEENNLPHHISLIRRALGEASGKRQYVLTVAGRGYRFIAPVSVADGEPATPAITTQRQSRSRPILAAAAAVLFVAVAAAAFARLSGAGTIVASEAIPITRFGLAESVVTDGERLYITQRKGSHYSIVQTPVSGGDPVEIATPFANATVLDIAPDHRSLLINSFENNNDDRPVWILPLFGGSPRRVEGVTSGFAAWSPDGQSIAFTTGFELHTIAADGSQRRTLANLSSVTREPGTIAWSPDGRTLRFSAGDPVHGGSSLWQVGRDGHGLARILDSPHDAAARWGEGQCCGVWTRSGYFFYREAFFPDIGIWAVRVGGLFGGRRAERVFSSGLDLANLAASPDGRRLYAIGRQEEAPELARYDRANRQFVPFPVASSAGSARPSPDGREVAYLVHPDNILWRVDAAGNRLQLTFAPMQAFDPVWSPDGARIAFHSLRPGRPGKVDIVSANGGPVEELFEDSTAADDVPSWSPDSQRLMFSESGWSEEGSRSRIMVMDLKTKTARVLSGSEGKGSPAWSPDGRYVAAESEDLHQLMLFDFRSRTWRMIARGGYIHAPQWSRDSKALFYQDPSAGEAMPIFRYSVAKGATERFADRAAFLRSDVSRFSLISLTADDEPVVSIPHAHADVYAITLKW